MKRILVAVFILSSGGLSLAQELTVFAASSLTEAFSDIARAFEAQHDGVKVLLNFDGSSTLALQISQGAPADIFASANETQMDKLLEEGLAEAAKIFARNQLVIISPEDSSLDSVDDLAQKGLLLVLASPEVPVGNYAREVLQKLNEVYGADFAERVLANLVSQEPNVRQVTAKVELGEADAAIVYTTDAAVNSHIKVIEIPPDSNVLASYPVAVLKESKQPTLAQAFVDFVLSEEGQTMLVARGFQTGEQP